MQITQNIPNDQNNLTHMKKLQLITPIWNQAPKTVKLNDWCCLLNLSYVWVISGRREPGENIMTHPVQQCLGAAEVRPPSLRRREQHRAPSHTFVRSVPSSHTLPGITWPRMHMICQMKFSFFFCNCSYRLQVAAFTTLTAIFFVCLFEARFTLVVFMFVLCRYFLSHQSCITAYELSVLVTILIMQLWIVCSRQQKHSSF